MGDGRAWTTGFDTQYMEDMKFKAEWSVANPDEVIFDAGVSTEHDWFHIPFYPSGKTPVRLQGRKLRELPLAARPWSGKDTYPAAWGKESRKKCLTSILCTI
jgi:hypothetical protein